MQLNLSQYNAGRLQIDSNVLLSKPIVDKLTSCFSEKIQKVIKDHKKKEGLFLFFGEDYTIGRKKHYSRAIVSRLTRQKACDVTINYAIGMPPLGIKHSDNYRPISDLLNCLSGLEMEVTSNVEVTFIYSGKKYKCTVIDLPIPLEGNEFFSEIRGIRFSKTEGEKVAYTIVMDRPTNKDIYNNVTFQYTGIFSKDLPERILKYADQISRRLINER